MPPVTFVLIQPLPLDGGKDVYLCPQLLERWFGDHDDIVPATDWVAKRVFGGGTQGHAVMVLDSADLWSADDLRRLHAVIARRPVDQGLCIIMSMPSVLQIASGMLARWHDRATGQLALPEGFRVELVVGTRSGSNPAGERAEADILALLGIEETDANQRENVRRSLKDDRLTPEDIVALLVLGSTRESSFFIAYDDQNTEPSLDTAMADYFRFCSDDPDSRAIHFEPGKVVARVKRAPRVFLSNDGDTKRSTTRLIGLAAGREDLVAALAAALGPDTERLASYIGVMEGCGALFNLRESERILAGAALTFDDTSYLLRRLQAAGRLLAGKDGFAGHRRIMLEQAWGAVADHFEKVRPADHIAQDDKGWQTEDARLDGILPELAGLVFGATAPDAALGRTRIAALFDGEAATGSLAERLQRSISDTITALAQLEPGYGDRLFERQLRGPWRKLGPLLGDKMRSRLVALRATLPPFEDRLAAVNSAQSLLAILKALDMDLPRLMTKLFCVAVRCCRDDEERLSVARLIGTYRALGLKIDPDVHVTPVRGGTLAACLGDKSIVDLLRRQAAAPASEVEEGADVYLGAFDSLNAEVKGIVDVLLDRQLAAEPAPDDG